MREMSTEMLNLLKSGLMIGNNKPTTEVVIGSGGDSYDWQNPSALRLPKGRGEQDYHPSMVKLNDGRLLFMYSRSGSLYQAYVSQSVDYILGNDDFITTEVVVLSGMSNPRATIFQSPTGNLYFIVAYIGTTTENIARLEVYKSALKDGSDWSLYVTIKTQAWGGGNLIYEPSRALSVSAPTFLDSGRWVISAPSFFSVSGYIMAKLGYYTSDDDGLNWSLRHEEESGLYSIGIDGGSRNIPIHKGKLWSTWFTTYGSTGYYKLLSSDDDGITWVQVLSLTQAELEIGVLWEKVLDSYLLSDGDRLYGVSGMGGSGASAHVYYLNDVLPQEVVADNFNFIGTLPITQPVLGRSYRISTKIDGKIIFLSASKDDEISGGIAESIEMCGVDIVENTLQAKSITISRAKGMAGGLTLELDNKDAILAPDGTTNPQLLWPNKEVIVRQGYGAELLKTFTGLIDSISMSRDEQGVASVTVSARDKLKVALDHLIRNQDFLYTLTYTNMLVEDIWKNLVGLAGLTYNTVESTGLTISEKIFSWETYADAFSWLDEISGFETYCDEEGLLNFVWDGRPSVVTTAYSFVEGVDITRLGYEINDVDLYYTVAVYGKSPEILDENDEVVTESMVIYFARQLPQAGYWNIPSGKVLRIDAPDADTLAKCEIIADKAIYLMQTRARQVTFSTIGIPHLQRGDFIQVEESSTTISEIYRITDITTQQGPDGYGMTLTCYYHSAPEVV